MELSLLPIGFALMPINRVPHIVHLTFASLRQLGDSPRQLCSLRAVPVLLAGSSARLLLCLWQSFSKQLLRAYLGFAT